MPETPSRLPSTCVPLFLLAAWLYPTASAGAEPLRTVVAIYWGTEANPSNITFDQAIREVLLQDSGPPVDYFAEYLESDRFPEEVAAVALRDYLLQKYRDRRPPDVVIAVTEPALQFVVRFRDELFGDAPIVYTGQRVEIETIRALGWCLTGVIGRAAYADTLKVALDLHPSIQRVFVVLRSTTLRRDETVRHELSPFARRVQLNYVAEETVPRLLEKIKAVPRGSLVLYIWHSQDDTGNLVYTDTIARLVAQVSPVPVYGTSELYVGAGVIGGVVRATHATGTRLGEMARDILHGRRPEEIPVETAPVVATFDWRQMRRWAVDQSRLPAGSDIRFKVPTAWESYRGYILASVLVIAGQLVLIVGLVTQRAKRRRAEETLRASEATLRTSYERIRQLAGGLIKAQESARAEIARDLHDDVCQDLFSVSVALSSLKRSLRSIPDEAMQTDLAKLQGQAVGTAERVRRLSHDLHPASLRLLGLAAATKAHCIEVEKRYDVQVGFRAEGNLACIDEDVGLCLFRIAQEALRNGAVHGDARRLTVSIIRVHDEIDLIVTDDGTGFDLDSVRRNSSGLGLISIEERARTVGGSAEIVSVPGHGTTVRVRVAVAASDPSYMSRRPS